MKQIKDISEGGIPYVGCAFYKEETGVDPVILDPVLMIFDPGRTTQKATDLGNLT